VLLTKPSAKIIADGRFGEFVEEFISLGGATWKMRSRSNMILRTKPVIKLLGQEVWGKYQIYMV
jgi:hypothetical protein